MTQQNLKAGSRPAYGAMRSLSVDLSRLTLNPLLRSLSTHDQIFDHCHQERDIGNNHKAIRKLTIATVLCLIFMVIEIVGGNLANSLAIATDAAHLFADLASFMISLLAIWLTSKPSTQQMSFGWHRAEVIGGTISILLIWVVTGGLVYEAIRRMIEGEYDVDASVMMITSAIGVCVNIIMGCCLHQHGHMHNANEHENDFHGHSHAINRNKEENINVNAAFIHVVGDFVQSLGVFTAAIIIYFQPNLKIVDPICTLIFSILVLATTISISSTMLNVLMQGIPNGVDFSVVKDTILKVPGTVSVHNLRIWGLTTNKTALSAHLVIDTSRSSQEILKEATLMIRKKYDVYEMTLQVENHQKVMETCTQCQECHKA